MECNKDEAVRAKEIAEKKLLERDTAGAKKFALKAQCLFSELEGLSQFLEIINVYVAHEKKINGVTDYYGIFGVDPFVDEEILRKQYKKMAFSLHPDKNKSIGADGAFQIMSEAWSVLSDKEKRSAHNLKVNVRSLNETASFSTSNVNYKTPATDPLHVPTRPSTTGAATSQSCSSTSYHQRNTHNAQGESLDPRPGTSSMNVPKFQQSSASMQFQNIVHPRPRKTALPSENPSLIRKFQRTAPSAFDPGPPVCNQNVPSRNKMGSSTSLSGRETFWTLCNRCRIQYEYQNKYLNQTLLCRRCQKPFLAKAMPDPHVNNSSSHPCPFPDQQEEEEMSVASPPSASRTSQDPLSQPSKKNTKRRHEVPINMGRANNPPINNSCRVPENVETVSASYTASQGGAVKRRRKEGQKCDSSKEGRQGKTGSGTHVSKTSADVKGNLRAEQSRSGKELSQSNIRLMLIGKAKAEIHRQLNEWAKEKLNASPFNEHDTGNIVHDFDSISQNHPQTKNQQTLQPRESSTLKETTAAVNSDDFVLMSVPDANFHNFDKYRIENSFTHNQVWAAYDDDDGMPRYYAMVNRVISRSPFKMKISWLNSKSSSEFGSLDWIGSGFPKTTGNYRYGKFVVSETLNTFSHPVKWKKGPKGVIQILPTKGDVWALYRNWSADWNETTADETIHKYDLVVVLQDYNEDVGVSVAPLVKVAGFTSVFKQLPNQRGIQIVPREEMYRFSHQVPFYLLNGLEAENAPKNCYELDPAALPLELLNATADVQSTERMVADPGMLTTTPGLENGTMAGSCVAKSHANQRGKSEDPKYVYTYSRRNKRKKIEGGGSQR